MLRWMLLKLMLMLVLLPRKLVRILAAMLPPKILILVLANFIDMVLLAMPLLTLLVKLVSSRRSSLTKILTILMTSWSSSKVADIPHIRALALCVLDINNARSLQKE